VTSESTCFPGLQGEYRLRRVELHRVATTTASTASSISANFVYRPATPKLLALPVHGFRVDVA
jgi:hypothetical protein